MLQLCGALKDLHKNKSWIRLPPKNRISLVDGNVLIHNNTNIKLKRQQQIKGRKNALMEEQLTWTVKNYMK
jgi:hypothetical protein